VMRAVLADTGPLFAAADEDDSDHEKAVRQTDELDRHGLIVVVPYPILLEAYSLVLKRFGSNAALRWLGNAVDASLINPTPEDYSVACAFVRALSDQDISLVDATVAALAKRLNIEVWTYDHHFDVMRVPVWRG
jgi:predicted nucleic acid-binding protein